MKAELGDTEKQLEECTHEFRKLRNELFKLRCSYIDSVIGSNQYVRMELVQFGDVSKLEEDFRRELNLTDGVFPAAIYDEENKNGISYIAEGKESGFDYKDKRFDNRIKDYKENQPTILDNLNAWYPEDLLVVKYSKDPLANVFVSITKGASDGQKAAAILAFLLSDGKEPLIIDQPEDDLDNELISDLIVSQIHKNKTRRQLIIATHNPNIVVNGDAELVVAMKYAGGQVQIGALDGIGQPKIRDSICNIMEGGRSALKKRYERMILGRRNV
jgi:hypothetical protein